MPTEAEASGRLSGVGFVGGAQDPSTLVGMTSGRVWLKASASRVMSIEAEASGRVS
jgi:hypothetical protein